MCCGRINFNATEVLLFDTSNYSQLMELKHYFSWYFLKLITINTYWVVKGSSLFNIHDWVIHASLWFCLNPYWVNVQFLYIVCFAHFLQSEPIHVLQTCCNNLKFMNLYFFQIVVWPQQDILNVKNPDCVESLWHKKNKQNNESHCWLSQSVLTFRTMATCGPRTESSRTRWAVCCRTLVTVTCHWSHCVAVRMRCGTA